MIYLAFGCLLIGLGVGCVVKGLRELFGKDD